MHIKLISGSDAHHIAEAIFKAFARALDQASQREERLDDVPSTKGLL
jgi:imidazoleglycerol-phosphate dehydratase